MKKTEQLARRLTEVILNGTWVANTNYRDQIGSLNWKLATATVGEHNSIAILAQHIHYYIHGIKNVFEGGNLEIRDRYSFDFPPISSQTQWEAFLIRFWDDTEALTLLIAQLPEERLDKSFVDEKYGSYLRNIDGMIEHSYYHLGQIVLIKKMVLGNVDG